MKTDNSREFDDDDLMQLLNTAGVYEGVIKGAYNCMFCGSIITLDNIDSLIAKNDEVEFCCTKENCRKNKSTHFRQ